MRKAQLLLFLLVVVAVGLAATFMFATSYHVSLDAASIGWRARFASGYSSEAGMDVGLWRSGGGGGGIPLQAGAQEDRACEVLLTSTARVMFLVLGGRGYHDVRVRGILGSWARCVRHVLIFTDPSVNISGYVSDRRYVYLSAGDAWRRRPYLPMTHMEALGRLISKPGSPSSEVSWFFMVTDRTFVDVRALLHALRGLDPSRKGYYGQVANSTHKEAFGFHDYVDLNTGVLLSAALLKRIVDPAECHDQKSAGGTFDMFDAKLGNCIFYLGATPSALPGFRESERAPECVPGGGLEGVLSFGKVEPREMARLAACVNLLSPEAASRLEETAAAAEHTALRPEHVAMHVMARETKLSTIVEDCEATWASALQRVYYHADRAVALESYAISKGRWGVSRNLAAVLPAAVSRDEHYRRGGAAATGAASRLDSSSRRARVAALALPERPGSGGEHWKISHDKGMGWNTWLRFKMKAIFEWSVRAHWAELRDVRWYVYVDDDTYVLGEPLLTLLRKYNPDEPHYFGRPLQEEGFPAFVGGGAGIVLSRAAALAILALRDSSDCDPLNLKWGDRIHQGGDAWLGDCAEAAGVHTEMEYGFYPQPPVGNLFHLYADAVCFHGVEDHALMHASLAAYKAANASERHASLSAYDPRCVPVFVDHRYTCLPHFIIGGAPKAGTTSLYKYLLEHPEVKPAKDKELTFWGNFFTPKHRPGREEVTTNYLDKFPYIAPSDFQVTGEATPGYLYCLTCPTYILKYMPKVRLLFSLRNPIARAFSEYLNKKADRTVMRYLHKRIDNKMDKELSSYAPPFSKLVDDVARTMESCGEPNRTYSMMDEYDDDMERDKCYVNPFVGEGRYARYLRLWFDVVPPSQLLLLNFDEWTAEPSQTMARVSRFLGLAPFDFRITQAHNTHLSRSVHVQLHGASNLSVVAADAVESSLSFNTHCILHEFFRPFQADLEAMLRRNGYPPMQWDTARKGSQTCPSSFRHWPLMQVRGQ